MLAVQLLDERDALRAGGRIARVVEVHERDVHVLARGDVEHARGLDAVATSKPSRFSRSFSAERISAWSSATSMRGCIRRIVHGRHS